MTGFEQKLNPPSYQMPPICLMGKIEERLEKFLKYTRKYASKPKALAGPARRNAKAWNQVDSSTMGFVK